MDQTMTAVKLGWTQYNHDARFERQIEGPKGVVSVTDAGPPFFSGTFLVEGLGRKVYVSGLGDALRIAREITGQEATR